MTMGNLAGFNAEEVAPQDNFEPLPAGWYQVIITDSEMKPTKDQKGEYLQLEYTVIAGEHEGRKCWDRLNLQNQNQTAVEIAQRALSSICRAVGVMAPNDSTELHDRPYEVKLSVRPATTKKDANGNEVSYDATNDVKAYRTLAEGAAAAPAPAAARPAAGRTLTATPRSGATTPPWKRAAAK